MKKKIALYLYQAKIDEIDCLVTQLGVSSRTEFIENAINNYMEQYYLAKFKHLPASIETVLLSSIEKLEQNVSSFLFKNAVEMAMMAQVLAMIAEIAPEDLRVLREQVTVLVKHSIGQLDLEAMMKQREKEGD